MRQFIIPTLLAIGLTAAAHADTLRLRPDAPARYVVKKGDTLWDISGRYLYKPWYWPKLWNLNRAQIKDPHWIYPGDVLVLDRRTGTLRLERGGRPLATEKLAPHARVMDDSAVGSVNAKAIQSFLARPAVVDEDEFFDAPRIVAGTDSRSLMGAGDTAYADKLGGSRGQRWQIYRPVRQLTDPDTGEKLGYEVAYAADSRVEQPAQGKEAAVLTITRSASEVSLGDRLRHGEDAGFVNYAPHAPDKQVSGKVIGTYAGVESAGQFYSVVVNRGARDGLEPGHVLAVKKAAYTTQPDGTFSRSITIPAEPIGHLFVYKVAPKVAYGLLLGLTKPASVGDEVSTPADE